MSNWDWSAAARCGDLLNLATWVDAVRAAGAVAVHVDIVDGRFQPGFGLGGDVARSLAAECGLPVDLHAAIEEADGAVSQLIDLGCASVTLPVECLTHAHRALTAIRDAGIRAGLAIGPGTPLTALEYLLPFVDRVLILAEPVSGSEALPPATFERVRIVRENVDYHKHDALIEVEGAIDPKDCAQLIAHGANRLIVADPALHRASDPAAALADFIEEVRAQQYVV